MSIVNATSELMEKRQGPPSFRIMRTTIRKELVKEIKDETQKPYGLGLEFSPDGTKLFLAIKPENEAPFHIRLKDATQEIIDDVRTMLDEDICRLELTLEPDGALLLKITQKSFHDGLLRAEASKIGNYIR